MILYYIGGGFKSQYKMLCKQLKYHNHYQTLNIQQNATQQQIKKKFKQLAKLYHPDSNPKQDNNSQFIKIKEAYDCLKDYNLRRQYDRTICPQKEQEQMKNFYYYRTEQNVFQQASNAGLQREYQRRKLIIFMINAVRFICIGFIFYYMFKYTLVKTQHQLRRQNIILSGENIDSGPSAIQRRKKQYASQMKEKKIYGRVIQLNIKGGYEESTRARTKRLSGIASIQGIKKQGEQIINFNQKVEFM